MYFYQAMIIPFESAIALTYYALCRDTYYKIKKMYPTFFYTIIIIIFFLLVLLLCSDPPHTR
jgi:hypothetical protein